MCEVPALVKIMHYAGKAKGHHKKSILFQPKALEKLTGRARTFGKLLEQAFFYCRGKSRPKASCIGALPLPCAAAVCSELLLWRKSCLCLSELKHESYCIYVKLFHHVSQVQRKLARALGRRTARRSVVPSIGRASRAVTGNAFGKGDRLGATVGIVTMGLLLPLALLPALPTCLGKPQAHIFMHFRQLLELKYCSLLRAVLTARNSHPPPPPPALSFDNLFR